MYSGVSYFTNVAAPKTADRALELVLAPFINPSMFWLVIPLIIVTLFTALYYGRHKYEEIGWNTAISNSLVLMFVSIDLLRYIFYSTNLGVQNYVLHPAESIISLLILIISFFMIVISYKHKMKKTTALIISSPIIMNTLAYVIMAIVYSFVPPDLTTFVGAILLFIIIFSLLEIVLFIQKLLIRHDNSKRIHLGQKTISEESTDELEEELEEKNIYLEKAKSETETMISGALKKNEKQLKSKQDKEKKASSKK